VAFDARTTHESRHGTCDERASDVPGSADEAGDVCASPMRRDFHARFSPERLRKSKSETFWQNGATGCQAKWRKTSDRQARRGGGMQTVESEN
jgi:hypothetical protein